MSITHIEDLPLAAFIKAVRNIQTFHASEKLDGANLWMGLDDEGNLFTSREGKRKGSTAFKSEADYPQFAAYNGFRAAHAALAEKLEDIKRVVQPGQMVEMEILYGRQPNAVTYGAEDKSYIAFLRGVNGTPDVIADQLTTTLGGQSVKVNVSTIETTDGENLEVVNKDITWQFTGAQRVDPAKLKDVDLEKHLTALEEYLRQSAGLESSPELTNLELLQNSLATIPVADRPVAKDKKAEVVATVMTKFRLPIKRELLDNYIAQIKPALGDKDLSADEDVGIEGVVLRDPTNSDLIKIVDKDAFTTINSFNHAIRNQISGVVKTLDSDAPLEARGGIIGHMKIQIADLLGNKELARGSTAKKAFAAVKGGTPIDTVKAFAANLSVDDFLGTKRKMLALIQQAALDMRTLLQDFKDNKEHFQLKLKNGKTIGISAEIEKRTLLVFAESRRNIIELFDKVKKAKTIAQVIATIYGHLAKAVHDQETDVPMVEESKKPSLLPVIGQDVKIEDFHKLDGFEVDGARLLRDGKAVGDLKLELVRDDKNPPHLVVRDIRITSTGKGTGTAVLKSICAKADDAGIVVALTTEAMLGAAHQKRLRQYYETLGFVKNRGEDKVPGVKEEYVRKLSVNESLILVERKFDTDKALYKKDAYTLMNIYFATVLMAIIIYKSNDAKGMRLLKDKTHYRMTRWDAQMSPLNFWGYPVWHASSPVVKKLVGPKAATQIYRVTRRAAKSQSLYLHMDLSFGKDVPIEWADHFKTLHLLQQFEGLNIDRINSLMHGLFNYETLTHDQQVKTISKLYYYVQQFIPASPLFVRVKAIQDELLLNANGENDAMVPEKKLLANINALVENEEDPDENAEYGQAVDTIARTKDVEQNNTGVNRARKTEKRKRNPSVKKAKFPKPNDEDEDDNKENE